MITKPKTRTSFIPDPNFQAFYRIFSTRKLGILSTGIILTASFLQLLIFLLQSFISLTGEDSDFVSVINTLTNSVYTINILKASHTIYVGIRAILFIFAYSYLALFLFVRWATVRAKKYNFIEKSFGLLNNFYAAVILLPTMEMTMREISCDELVLVPLQQECAKGGHIFVLICAIIAFLCSITMTLMNIFYSLNGIYDKKNYFSGENKMFDLLQVLVKITIAIVMANSTNTRGFLIGYLSIQIVFSIFLVLFYLTTYPYNKIFVEYLALIGISSYFAEAFSFLLYILIDDKELTCGYIFSWMIITIVPGILYTYRSLKVWLTNKEETSSITMFLIMVQNLLQLKQTEKVHSFEELSFRGILIRHMTKCSRPRCFCKELELFETKKKRYIEQKNWHTNKSIMLKYYVKHLFEEMVKKYPGDPDLLIAYAEFLFEKFRNTHLALFQIMKLIQSNIFMHPFHRFKIFKLKNRISEYINAQNVEALDKTLEIESAIFVEEQLDKVVKGMREIIANSINFWNYLMNKELELPIVSELILKMHNSVENTDDLWGPLKAYLGKQKRLLYFYNWFVKDFLHRRILLSEEEIDDLFENDTFSVYSNDFLNILRDDTIIFQEDSAIIHMSGHYADLGRIIKTNRAATKIFKYTKEELEKSNINILMPKIIADNHNSYLDSYIRTGKTQILYNQIKTFAKDRDGFIIPMWIIVKQLNNSEGYAQYVGLLRPLSQKKDEQSFYMLLNDLGEINGISRNLVEHLKLPGDIFQKKMINVVLLAPKLIKYLDFARLLHDEKEKKETGSGELDSVEITKENSPKKESKLSKLGLYKTNPSPFMTSNSKVLNLKDFLDLDNLKIDGVPTLTKLDEKGSTHGRDDDDGDGDRIFRQEYDNKEIEFTFRLPENLAKFLKDFNSLKARKKELLNNQRLLLTAIGTKNMLKEAANSPDKSPKGKLASILKGKNKVAMHLTQFKHGMDSYLEALKTISHQIANSNSNNVYRIKGTITTDQYGPDRDVIKYIKIIEITKKIEKFSNFQAYGSERGGMSTPKNERRDSASLSFATSLRSEKVSPLKSKFFPVPKPSGFKFSAREFDDTNRQLIEEGRNNINSENDIPKESIDQRRKSKDEEGINGIIEDIDSPLTSPSKMSQLSGKSSKKGEDEEESGEEKGSEGSKAESVKHNLLNELQTNLLAPFQSIYQKEENLLMDNNFHSLNRVKWFIRILFLTILPMNITLYFAGANVSFHKLSVSISDIYLNEDLRKDYMRAHNSMITLLLDNNGAFNNVTGVSTEKLNDLRTFCNMTLQDSYQSILTGNNDNAWTSVLYKYLPKVQGATSMNYQGVFANLNIDTENGIQKLTNSLSDIYLLQKDEFTSSDTELTFYRSNSLQKFNIYLSSVTTEIFASLQKNFDDTERVSTIMLILEIVIFFLSFFAIIRLLFVVMRSLKEILTTFTSIENKYLREAQKYFRRLGGYLEASTAIYITDDVNRGFFDKVGYEAAPKQVDNNTKYKKVFKSIKAGEFMRQSQVRILGYYSLAILLSICLTVVFHVMTITSLNNIQTVLTDSQTFFKLNPLYIVSLIGLKELYNDKNFYKEFDFPYMGNILEQLDNTLNTNMFQTDLRWVKFLNGFMNGNPCVSLADFLTADEIQDCESLGLSRLASGLIAFHNFYGDYVFDSLEMNNKNNFGTLTIDNIYEFGQLIQIIDSVFMEMTLSFWREDMNSYLASKERLIIILLVFISLLNLVVFVGAENIIVGNLNRKFLLYRKIFNKYMLGEALVREKRIKSRLVKYKLLNK